MFVYVGLMFGSFIQGPPGDFGLKGIQGPKGPQGSMVSTHTQPLYTHTYYSVCVVIFTCWFQGRGGLAGPVGVIGPIGSPVSIYTLL